ncbi:hypothetical protein [Variovorax terrae]|uniref:Uncharacterized protein n=1 Tax=Variovorax terrae TaxID=2923278 RepID=A0A9X1VTJ3_9BURK|nr:hypothetical protein [Variovorax terrae]MCJ0763033.1 hypothetical protein [Variovorax terrae]
MSAWLSIAAPYLPEIIKLAQPLFTRAKSPDKSPEVMAQQIAELQAAATQNAEAIKLLATQMQGTIDGLQAAATTLEKKLQRAYLLAVVAATVAVLGFGVAAYALGR